MTEYAKRDARALEPYYNRHVSAMTRERLDAKRGAGWDANPWVFVIEFERVEPKP